MIEDKQLDNFDYSNERVNYIDNFYDYGLDVVNRIVYFQGTGSDFSDATDVDSASAQQTIKSLLILDHLNHNEITLLLSTNGGDWDSGVALYSIIKALNSPVKIISLGNCFSMGSVILQSAKIRQLMKYTMVMIHNGTFSMQGEAVSSERWADVSKIQRKTMYQIYFDRMVVKNPKITLKEIENLCTHDTILSAEETVDVGLADEVIDRIV